MRAALARAYSRAVDAETREYFEALRQDVSAIRREMATKEELAAVRREMATKEELAAGRRDMASKADLVALEERIDAKIDRFRAEFIAEIHELRRGR